MESFEKLLCIMGWLAMAAALQQQIQVSQPADGPSEPRPSAWQRLAASLPPVQQPPQPPSRWLQIATEIAAAESEANDSDLDLIIADCAPSPAPAAPDEQEPQQHGQQQEHQLVLVAGSPGVCSDAVLMQLIEDKPMPMNASVLHDAVLCTVTHARDHPSARSDTYNLLMDQVLDNRSHNTSMTLEELSNRTQRNRRALPTDMCLLASAITEVCRMHRSCSERRIRLRWDENRRISFIDGSAYDETPMPVVTEDLAESAQLQLLARLSGALVPADESQPSAVSKIDKLPSQTFDTAKLVVKLFQSKQKYGMVILLDPERQFYGIVIGESTNWLQRLESTTGICTCLALEKTAALSAAACDFKLKARTSTSDEAKSNPKAEELLLARRGPSWSSWRFGCEIHKGATCHEHTFIIVEDTVSGMINCSLSCNFGSNMSRFRSLVKNKLKQRAVVIGQHADAEAQEWKAHILRILLSTGTKKSYRCMILVRLLPGDWRNRTQVEIQLDEGETLEKKLDMVADGVTSVLAGAKLHRWPRHRWKGYDIALGQLGLLDAVHGILSFTYPDFVDSFRPKKGKPQNGSDANAGPGAVPLAALADRPAGVEAQPEGGNGVEQPIHSSQPHNVSEQSNGTAEDNARFRSKGLEFVESEPLNKLLIMRLVLEPLRTLLENKLYVGSKRYELHQAAAAAEASRGDTADQWPHRQFAVTVAALNVSEDIFFQKLGQLSDSRLWTSVSNVTVTSQALAFRLISRSGCMVEELLRDPHTRSKFSVFKVLYDGSVGSSISSTPDCLLHPAVRELVEVYSEDFGCTESKMHLYLLAILSKTDVGDIECLHAVVRRLLAQRIQTNGRSMPDACAEWVLRGHRMSECGFEDRVSKRKPDCNPEGQPPAKKLKFCANSWHLFCRQVLSQTC